ncbi:MAG: antibiotic biosynthesis monooxygenase [Cellulophaga sp.]|uniref:antibiotic biosynthesis monooxygenase family protein n=1 Tax=unclassified Cellulophaga TaxID=2634405 RepID=UPI000C2BBBA1|nr:MULTISPECIES: antibiotic biosynthesis monooxygenase [unclassified Cellulophaga]MDO6491161.1 antibiotic biosynthesis monooxygenase [Cellulophaga sp. 2_MG-2023]MDO6495306.1 antibiotic biosynthesis monooxygenase [Cellulophaga sp. 3_MG-2023]
MMNTTPYYAVIFTSTKIEEDSGYNQMATQMEELAKEQAGFIGIESARESVGITVSYWSSLEAIANWKKQTDHKLAQEKGRKEWYTWFKVRICKVEREYEFFK